MRLPKFKCKWWVSQGRPAQFFAIICNGSGNSGWRDLPPCHIYSLVLLLLCVCFACAEDPCGGSRERALVLGGGGVKGAFEAGAVYHLVAHRHCDFSEFSGVSVGALNATFLAQARKSGNPEESYANLLDQSEALVSLWQSLRSSRDVARNRILASVRFGVFGLDSLADLTPLRRLEDRNIAMERLSAGRPVRVGVVSFYDGEYQEILAGSLLAGKSDVEFREYLSASSTPPVIGRLPKLAATKSEGQQFADGSLRHMTPVGSYFAACPQRVASAEDVSPTIDYNQQRGNCPTGGQSTPPHEPIQQLFVVATSPYDRNSESSPVVDRKCCSSGRRQITDGRKILGRTLALLDDEVYRRDLDFLLSANDVLTWRWQVYQQLMAGVPPEQAAAVKQRFQATVSFAFESYNRDPEDPSAPSRPYEIGLVLPEKEFADLGALISISPEGVQEQLYCGCVAADEMMQKRFGVPALTSKCAEHFLGRTRPGRSISVAQTQFDPSMCTTKTRETDVKGVTTARGAALDDGPKLSDRP